MKRRSLVGQLVVWFLGAELLFFASFATVELPTATRANLLNYARTAAYEYTLSLPYKWQQKVREHLPVVNEPGAPVRFTAYSPLLPVSVFIGYVLGVPLAVFSAATFLLAGFLGPRLGIFPFASGGGFTYWQEPSFGYLCGILLSVWLTSRIAGPERKSLRQLGAAIGGMLSIHALGLLYLVGSSLLILLLDGEAAYLAWQPYLPEQIRNLSWYTLPYDLVLAVVLVGAGFPARWLIATLTAPDAGMRGRGRPESRIETLTGSHSETSSESLAEAAV